LFGLLNQLASRCAAEFAGWDHDAVREQRDTLAERLRVQAGHCATNGSPLYDAFLLRAADDALAGGPVWRLFEGRDAAPADSAPLALMGAVHRLALTGLAPGLAPFFPSVAIAAGATPVAGPVAEPPDADAAWPEFLAVVDSMRDWVVELLSHPIQTNEVGRAAALLGGFLEVARLGLPLRLAELGASAGLNLRWDRFRYEDAWGDPASPVRFARVFDGDSPRPSLDVPATVAERGGCDRAPVDPTTEEGRLTLMSYVWADQAERFSRLRGALEIAREVPATVERADALDWLDDRLQRRQPGTATVVYHSIVALYFSLEQRQRLASLLGEAGAGATDDEPLAWLRFEHPDTGDPVATGWSRIGRPEVRLTVWPGGEERLLAVAAAHGPPVRWTAT
jgi:hypothetical protein